MTITHIGDLTPDAKNARKHNSKRVRYATRES